MKDLIKKQEEELRREFMNHFFGEFSDRKDRLCSWWLNKISKVRKETAEAVCDKMIGEEIYAICREEDDGYNLRIAEEKEIKKQIIESL